MVKIFEKFLNIRERIENKIEIEDVKQKNEYMKNFKAFAKQKAKTS